MVFILSLKSRIENYCSRVPIQEENDLTQLRVDVQLIWCIVGGQCPIACPLLRNFHRAVVIVMCNSMSPLLRQKPLASPALLIVPCLKSFASEASRFSIFFEIVFCFALEFARSQVYENQNVNVSIFAPKFKVTTALCSLRSLCLHYKKKVKLNS